MFSRWRKKKKAPRPAPVLVKVAYRDLTSPPVDEDQTITPSLSGYTFTWQFPHPPVRGTRVIIPGMEGMSPGVVLGYSSLAETGGYTLEELKTVHRLATDEELQAAHRKLEAAKAREAKDLQSWLNMARRAAGLPTKGRARANPPRGYPGIPPTEGTAEPKIAAQYGSAWWRAYKLAKKTGRPDEEVERFRDIGRHWFNLPGASQWP